MLTFKHFQKNMTFHERIYMLHRTMVLNALCIISISLVSHAETANTALTGDPVKNTNLMRNTSAVLNIGIAPAFDVLGEGVGNLNITFDKNMNNLVSLGAELGVKYGEHMHMDPNDTMNAGSMAMDVPYRFIGFPLMLRVALHVLNFGDPAQASELSKKLDVYVGIGGGYIPYASIDKIERDKLKAQGDPWDHDGHAILAGIVGVHYFITPTFGLYAESVPSIPLVEEGMGEFGYLSLGVTFAM